MAPGPAHPSHPASPPNTTPPPAESITCDLGPSPSARERDGGGGGQSDLNDGGGAGLTPAALPARWRPTAVGVETPRWPPTPPGPDLAICARQTSPVCFETTRPRRRLEKRRLSVVGDAACDSDTTNRDKWLRPLRGCVCQACDLIKAPRVAFAARRGAAGCDS